MESKNWSGGSSPESAPEKLAIATTLTALVILHNIHYANIRDGQGGTVRGTVAGFTELLILLRLLKHPLPTGTRSAI